jgi:alpha-tubulin suppressor-like RCC1 family protein
MTRVLVCISVLMITVNAFGQPRVAKPVFSVEGGEYSTVVMVTVTVNTHGATIRFTQNGLDPTEADPIIKSGARIAVNTSLILKARAFLYGRQPSEVRTAVYKILAVNAGEPLGPGDVAAGGAQSFVASPDGRVHEWLRDAPPQLMAGLSGVISIAAGTSHALALTADAEVFAWGGNQSGQVGDGTHLRRSEPVRVRELNDVGRLAAGRAHSLALTKDGRVWAWGSNNRGQLGLPSAEQAARPIAIPGLSDVVAIDAGDAHSVAVTRAGEVFAWGANNRGQLGDGTRIDRRTPTRLPSLVVAGVSAGATHTLALGHDGAVYSWGSGDRGELGTGSLEDATQPVMIASLRAHAVRAGRDFSAAVARDGTLMMWGANDVGQLGDGTLIDRSLPVAGPSVPSISALALGGRHALAVTATGDVWAWGSNASPVEAISDVADWGPPFAPEDIDTPTLEPASGWYSTPQSVRVSSIQEDVILRYTLDGTDPHAESPIYSAPLIISTSSLVKARAYSPRPGVEPSDVALASYTIDMTPPTIVANVSPASRGAWFTAPVTVTFECADDSGVVACPLPVVAGDGAQQLISGTAVDPAGNRTSTSVTLDVDSTAPAVLLDNSPDGSTTTATHLTLIGRVFDATSGIAGSLRCDGSVVSVVQDAFECDVALRPGVNSVSLQVVDAAGNPTSAGIVVRRIGESTSLAIAPDSRTLVTHEVAPLSLSDNFGMAVSGAAWSSSDPEVALLSDGDPPLVTAVGEGVATIRATKAGLSAEATIEVQAGPQLSTGTPRWTIASTPGLTMQMPIFTHRVEPDVPDMFVVESAPLGDTASLRAVTADGEVLWMQESPGIPLMGDSFGGVIAGVATEHSYDFFAALVRLGNAGGVRPWRYEPSGSLLRPAQAPDGALYAVEYVASHDANGEELWDKHAVVIDGTTGRLLGRHVLAREIDTFTAELDGVVVREQPRLVCRSTRREAAPSTIGPIVGSDGRGYLLVRRHVKHKFDTCVEQHSRHRRTIDTGVDLVILSPDGPHNVEPVFADNCIVDVFQSSTCDTVPELKQLMPDGVGGMLASVDRFGSFLPTNTVLMQRVVSRRDEAGTFADTEVDNTTWIDTVGQGGISYVYQGGAWSAIDVTSWAPKWTTNLGLSAPLAAHPDGGLSIFNYWTRTYETVDAGGVLQPESTMPLPLQWPMHEFGSWIGLSSRGLTSIAGNIDDATRWTGFVGNRQNQSAVRRPGIGIFAKAHHVNSAVPIWMHISLRITPSDSAFWSQHEKFGQYFREFEDVNGVRKRAVDVYGNPSATIGAGPYALNGEDTTQACLANSILEGRPNRPSDQLTRPIYSYQLPKQASDNPLIARLFELDAAYGDFLKYECLPDAPDEFNSNSYISGILDAAAVAKPWFFHLLPDLFPGWSKPVPARYFGQ